MNRLEQIIAQERKGILAEIKLLNDALPLVALKNDLEILRRVPSRARWEAPAILEPLDIKDATMGWVFSCPKLNYKSFWVLTSDNSYRDHYQLFLDRHHGYRRPIPDTFDVDHMYNRDRAKTYSYTYLRTFLVPYSPNKSHGAGYEASIGYSEAERDVSDMRTLDEIGYMKFMGIMSPRIGKPLTRQQKAHLKRVAVSTGLPYEDLERSVGELMAKANSGWAAKPH